MADSTSAGRESPSYGPLLVMDSMYPQPKGGGAESQVGTIGRWFNSNGYPCTLVTPMVANGPSLPFEVLDQLPVVRLAYPNIRLLGAMVLHLRLMLFIWRYRHKACAIHAHIGSWMAVTCCLMGRLVNLRVIVKMTGHTELVGGALDPKGNWLARLKRKGLSYASGYQAISRQIEQAIELVGLPAEKTLRIANAVDLETFGLRHRDGRPSAHDSAAAPLSPTGMVELDMITSGLSDAPPATAASGRKITPLREQICPGAEFVVLFSGRLVPVKRLDLLLQAWRDTLAHDKTAWLVLAGEGGSRADLQAQARDYGISDRVVFVGQVAGIADYIHAADILALVSDSEGLSNSMLEGMAGGLPVLGSRISGTEDFVVENKTGWLFSPGDLPALTRQLAAARATPARQLLEMSRAAHDEIVTRASLRAVVAALLDAYMQPMPSGRRR